MRKKAIAVVVIVMALVLFGSVALAQTKNSATVMAKSKNGTLLNKDVLCLAGKVCNINLFLQEEPIKLVLHAPVKKVKRTERVHALVKYVILPGGMAAAGAALFSAKWPTRFDGINNTIDYGSAWKGGLIGAGVGLVVGLIVDLLDN